LTTTFHKIIERCLQEPLTNISPPLDIAQVGFRPARSTLDQALCFTELYRLHWIKHKTRLTLAYLDLKNAYDTVDRNIIWNALTSTLDLTLLRILRQFFDNVHIEIILNNCRSAQFQPTIGVFRGSILFLCSININSLSARLHRHQYTHPPPRLFAITESINCLLYADNVAFIGTPAIVQPLLDQCADHSFQLAHQKNPTKSVILEPNVAHQYQL
jgi:hypothetical protein